MVKIKLPLPPRKPVLPQNEENPAARLAELKSLRTEYTLDLDNELGLPMLKTVPAREQFSSRYEFGRGGATLPMVVNEAAVTPSPQQVFAPYPGLASHESLYADIPRPEVIPAWLTDESFGEQRLSGLNPVMLRKVEKKEDLGCADVAQLENALGGQIDWPLYVVDFSDKLAGDKGGVVSIPGLPVVFQKYGPKPIGFFHWVENAVPADTANGKRGRLLPVAIQIDIDDHGGLKTVTPADPILVWTAAKTCFSIADANFHEMSTHLGRCHFALEAFGAVSPRQLAPQHPLMILLEPHLKFLVTNNQDGLDKLIQPNGPVDLLLAGTRQQSLDIAIKAAKEWSIAETFPQEIARRGMDDVASLPHYPYRDDGLLLWEATEAYVSSYLNVYYRDDCTVREDTELQAWARELASTSTSGGNVRDMPDVIGDRGQLNSLVTKIIFSLSTDHSSINFSQFPYLGFSPAIPLAGYADYRAFFASCPDCEDQQLEWLLKFLPLPYAALGQIAITFALSAYHYDQLGDYASSLVDPRARQRLYEFSQQLNAIERTITERNKSRLKAYRFMLPSEVLNGASI